MIAELTSEDYASVSPFLTGRACELVLAAVLAGNSRARVFVDQRATPTAVCLWDQANNGFYLAGDARNAPFTASLRALLAAEIAPRLRRRRPAFHVRVLAPAWGPLLPALFPEAAWTQGRYVLLAHPQPGAGAAPASLPAGSTLRRVDRAFFDQSSYTNLALVTREVQQMWPCRDRFLTAGYGVAVVTGARVVSLCTTEYVSHDRCGLGVQTIPAARNQGCATHAATAVVHHCHQAGHTPHWTCDVENGASRRVAAKVGFEPVEAYPVYHGTFCKNSSRPLAYS